MFCAVSVSVAVDIDVDVIVDVDIDIDVNVEFEKRIFNNGTSRRSLRLVYVQQSNEKLVDIHLGMGRRQLLRGSEPRQPQ